MSVTRGRFAEGGQGRKSPFRVSPHAPAHRVIGMPVRVEARRDLTDPGALQLELRLLGCVEEDVRSVHEGGRTGAREATSPITCLDAYTALATRAGNRGGPARAKDLDLHELIIERPVPSWISHRSRMDLLGVNPESRHVGRRNRMA